MVEDIRVVGRGMVVGKGVLGLVLGLGLGIIYVSGLGLSVIFVLRLVQVHVILITGVEANLATKVTDVDDCVKRE